MSKSQLANSAHSTGSSTSGYMLLSDVVIDIYIHAGKDFVSSLGVTLARVRQVCSYRQLNSHAILLPGTCEGTNRSVARVK
jgi:hypothetical protein